LVGAATKRSPLGATAITLATRTFEYLRTQNPGRTVSPGTSLPLVQKSRSTGPTAPPSLAASLAFASGALAPSLGLPLSFSFASRAASMDTAPSLAPSLLAASPAASLASSLGFGPEHPAAKRRDEIANSP
jgi:hypothetical protein